MNTALWLLTVQGCIGAFDTLYFHEYRAQLPAGGERTRAELRLHAARSILYAVIFVVLPRFALHGAWATVAAVVVAAEIVITLSDFVVEVRAREPIGVLAGERVTHAVMAILYGAFLAHLFPVWLGWHSRPTGCVEIDYGSPLLTWLMPLMGVGVLVSGLRDAYATLGLPGATWPYGCRDEHPNQAAHHETP